MGAGPQSASSHIFAIPVLNQWLIYAPLQQVSALVNRRAVSHLERGGLSAHATGLFSELVDHIKRNPQEIPRPREGPIHPEFLGLIPTRACNLACVYCGFGADSASTNTMDLNLIVRAVDWMAEHLRQTGRKRLEVHFFGGEPFLAGEAVDTAIHRTRAVAAQMGLIPCFEVATNGVFDAERAGFVGDHFDTVVLSFDGPKEIHDRLRPGRWGGGSFEAVFRTARLLSQSPADLCLRTCVTRDTVATMEETARWFCENLKPKAITFETLQATLQAAAAGLSPPDPYAFSRHYLRAQRVVAGYGIKTIYAASLNDSPRLSFCPVGNDSLILSPDGRISACYLPDSEWKTQGLDLDFGQLEANGTLQIDHESLRRIRQLVAERPRCQRCFCKWSCAGGCHVHHAHKGCNPVYDGFCIQTRLITACSILSGLGQDNLAQMLIEDQSAMETLALNSSDLLEDFEEANDRRWH